MPTDEGVLCILEFLRAGEGDEFSDEELAEHCGLGKRAIDTRLAWIENLGLVEAKQVSRNTKVLHITELGVKFLEIMQ